jgi:AcrR family transcriptional regulator
MSTKGQETRENILAAAEQIILKKGYTGTSIEEIIAASNITKSGFFYHYNRKNELSVGLVERYQREDDRIFGVMISRAESLSEDPLQHLLIFLRLMAEMFADLPKGHPGCLVASFTYESLQFDPAVIDRVRDGVLVWRELFAELIGRAAARYPMRVDIALDDLADMLTSVMEGGIVTSITLRDSDILIRQINNYRHFIRLLFEDVN